MSLPYIQIFRSRLKLDILKNLLTGDKDLSELKNVLGSSGSTIIHALNDLNELDFTDKDEKKYKLTPLGVIGAQNIMYTLLNNKVLEKYRDYWITHDITGLPANLLKDIGELCDSVLVRNDSTDLNKVHSTFRSILLTSKSVKGISPIFHPDFIEVFKKMLDLGAVIDLILTPEVLERTMSLVDREELLGPIEENKLNIFISDSLRVALTVTENSFSMGLYSLSGEYDYSMDLVSNNIKAIEWGERLYQYNLKNSIPFNQMNSKLVK